MSFPLPLESNSQIKNREHMGYFVITLGQAYGGEAKQMEALQDRTEKGPLLQW